MNCILRHYNIQPFGTSPCLHKLRDIYIDTLWFRVKQTIHFWNVLFIKFIKINIYVNREGESRNRKFNGLLIACNHC